jgi:Lrp/AsnC family transcriptional regulator for asnA, asnC and gidA
MFGEVGMAAPVVDDLDLAILAQLQEDGRRSFTEIADTLNVSVGTVRNRVSRMIEENTVQIVGRVNPHRVGFSAPATINVAVQIPHLEAAIAEISQFPEVSWLALVTGEYDLIVDVLCRDVDHLTELITRRLQQVPGVIKTETVYVLRILKVAQPGLELVAPDRTATPVSSLAESAPNSVYR